jgi:hypothetical protein
MPRYFTPLTGHATLRHDIGHYVCHADAAAAAWRAFTRHDSYAAMPCRRYAYHYFSLIDAAISPHSQRHLFRTAIAGAATLDARAMRDAQQRRCADALTPFPPCHAGARYAGDAADAACYAISSLMTDAERHASYATLLSRCRHFSALFTLILLITLSGAVTPCC